METVLESNISTGYAVCNNQSGIEHKEFSHGIRQLAVPAASLVGRHVDQDDAVGRRPELFAGDYAPEPLRLLFAVSVGGRKPVIADVAVGFVLAAVEYDEEDGTAAERIVTFAGRRGKR